MTVYTAPIIEYVKEHGSVTIREICVNVFNVDKSIDSTEYTRMYNRVRGELSRISRDGTVSRVEDNADTANPRCVWVWCGGNKDV